MTRDWNNHVHHGDCIELLEEMPEDHVDLVLTDPPYNLSGMAPSESIDGLDDMGRRSEDGGKVFNKYGDWDEDEIRPHHWVGLCEQVLADDGCMISFYDCLKMEELRYALDDVGFEFFSKYYWVKTNPAPQIRTQILMPGAEEMWLAAKGGGKQHWRNPELPQRTSAIHSPLPSGREYTEHPTQKPVQVMYELIRYHCPPDGVVLDPFLGSGTTAVAAEKAGRDWIGFEREEEYVGMVHDRLRTETHYGEGNAMEADW